MLTEYICAAMKKAVYQILEDGTFYGEITEFQGLLAVGQTLETCRHDLQSALEDWLVFSLAHHLPIPAIEGLQITIPEAA
jgi:predicted RNase H-like HicB family nuclease